VVIPFIILIVLFLAQSRGTQRIATLFGPIMLLWFAILAGLGLFHMHENLSVLRAFNPYYGVRFLLENGLVGFVILGSVFLAVTGAEALYANMGHFGRNPIRAAWLLVAFPALALNYLGQGAMVLAHPATAADPFYRMVPQAVYWPVLLMATLAAVIASQAVITGAFSMTQQAVQLGLVPRIEIKRTSETQAGQIFVPSVNQALMIGVLLLLLMFRSSSRLASAYGIAVTGTMATVTLLAAIVMIRSHKWNPLWAIPMFATFFVIDVTYFGANLVKFMEGGWFPVLVAAITFSVMMIWINGRTNLLAARWKRAVPLDEFLDNLHTVRHTRVEGTAIFMVPNTKTAPASLINNIRHSRIIHERVILMNVINEHQPYVTDENRLTVRHLKENFHIVTLHYGFFEEPRILRVLAQLRIQEFHFKLADVSFFIGREKIVSASENPIKKVLDELFITMHRNMLGATEYFQIPIDHVVEVGGITKLHDDDH
jgi:KUP system potassium uptake protein